MKKGLYYAARAYVGRFKNRNAVIQNQNAYNQEILRVAGVLKSMQDQKMIVADAHQVQLLERVGSGNLLSIFFGIIVMVTGVWILLRSKL